MKSLKYILVPMSALLLSACSGEKQNTRTDMQTREVFLINKSYPKDICMGQKLKDTLLSQAGLSNLLTSATDNSVNCAYFSRTSTSCVRFSFTEEYPESCVIAADRAIDKKSQRLNAKDIADLMIGLIDK